MSLGKVSPWREEFKAVWMEFSLLLSLKHVLRVIQFLNLNISICCACKDSTQNSSKIQDKSLLHLAVEKLGFPDLVTTPCKNCKNWDGSKGDLEDLNIDITHRKEDVNGDSKLLQNEKFDHNCSMVLKHREAFM